MYTGLIVEFKLKYKNLFCSLTETEELRAEDMDCVLRICPHVIVTGLFAGSQIRLEIICTDDVAVAIDVAPTKGPFTPDDCEFFL